MTRTTIVIAAGHALAAALLTVPAQAQVPRTFVSAAGSDSNNCANVTTPCRHFAAAYAATAPSGEIFVLDPANYGSLTITYAVSIEGHGWASIAPPNGGNAITIDAGPSDSISIHGVAINGTGATGGTNGIVFNSGGSLTVTDCMVQNFSSSGVFTGNGILLLPTSGTVRFVIANSIVSNNGNTGIVYRPPSGTATANGVIDHIVATNNQGGILIETGTGGGSTTVAISNGIASDNNVGINIHNGSASLAVLIDNMGITGNLDGIDAFSTTKVLLSRSVITDNTGSGIQNSTSPNTFYTYGNNLIDLNTTNINGPLNTTVTLR